MEWSRRGLLFTQHVNASQETFNHRRQRDMRGQQQFISILTLKPTVCQTGSVGNNKPSKYLELDSFVFLKQLLLSASVKTIY